MARPPRISTSALLAALRDAEGNQAGASRALGVSRQRVGQLVAGLSREEFAALSPFRADPRPARLPVVAVTDEEDRRVKRAAKRARMSLTQLIRTAALARADEILGRR